MAPEGNVVAGAVPGERLKLIVGAAASVTVTVLVEDVTTVPRESVARAVMAYEPAALGVHVDV